MKFPKYWARGKYLLQTKQGNSAPFFAWQWSDTSLAEAQRLADAKAQEIALKFQNRRRLERYSYGRNPLREEVVQSIKNSSGNEIGVITRNLYGALVLNAANAMFIDIDFPQDGQASLASGIGKLLGNKSLSPEQTFLTTIESWASSQPQWGVRVYRTFGGLRCLITNELFDPSQESSLAIMRALHADRLYVTLCRQQASFRARLTAKPWRCGADQPPSRYPWENVADATRYRDWQTAYTRIASRFVACRLVKQIGAAEAHPDIAPILSVHDELACSNKELELA